MLQNLSLRTILYDAVLHLGNKFDLIWYIRFWKLKQWQTILLQNYAEPHKIYLARPKFNSILAVCMSTTSMATFCKLLILCTQRFNLSSAVLFMLCTCDCIGPINALTHQHIEVDISMHWLIINHISPGLKLGPGCPGRRPGTLWFAGSIYRVSCLLSCSSKSHKISNVPKLTNFR